MLCTGAQSFGLAQVIFFFVCHVSFILGEAYIADGGAFHCSESVERSEYSWSNDAVEVAEAYVFFF